jgi:hypothetical protein
MRTIRCRITAGIAILLFVLMMLPLPAFAAERTGTLALWCVKDDEIITGMHWQIYRVGHREENDYVFEGAFSGYRPTLGDQTKPMLEWNADTVAGAAETLRSDTIIDKIPVRGEGFTDEKGNVNFSGLEDGLYLVIGDILKQGTKTYVPSAVFFEMNGQKEASLNSYPKIILETLDKQTAEYSVRKVWMNNKNQPPDESSYIICELYRDGELQETVRLDAGNDWLYQWSDQTGHEWLVREKEIPKNYSVVYKSNHTQYLIVNTYERPRDDSSVTDDNTTPASTTTTGDQAHDRQTTTTAASQITGTQTTAYTGRNTTQPGERSTTVQHSSVRPPSVTEPPKTYTTAVVSPPSGGSSGNTPSGGNTPAEVPKLPQTGQLWYPVPILACGGLALIAAGVWISKRDE